MIVQSHQIEKVSEMIEYHDEMQRSLDAAYVRHKQSCDKATADYHEGKSAGLRLALQLLGLN